MKTLQASVPVGLPRPDSSAMAKNRAIAASVAFPIVKPVALDRGNVLRIRDGRGTRLHLVSGVLWVTEEKSPSDHVLLPGDVVDLCQGGTAIASAHRVSRVVLEVPAGVAPPRMVEMAFADGESGERIALAVPTPISLATIATRLATVIGKVVASIRTHCAMTRLCLMLSPHIPRCARNAGSRSETDS